MTRAIMMTVVVGWTLACTAPAPDQVDVVDPVDDPEIPGNDGPDDVTDDPNPNPTPDGYRTLSDDELEALSAALGGVAFDLNGASVVGTFTLTSQSAQGNPTTTMMDGAVIQTAEGGGADVFEFTALVAWDNLDVVNQTVDEAFLIFSSDLVDPGSVNLGTVSSYIGDSWALYTDAVNDETFYGTTGLFDITGVTLDPATELDCSNASFSCKTIQGDLQGSLDMDSLGFPGAVYSNEYGMPSGQGVPLNVVATFDLPVTRTTVGAPTP